DRDAAAVVEKELVRDGVRLILDCQVRRVVRQGADKVIETACGGREEHVAAAEILLGVGRAPNVQGLTLEAAGVEYDEKKGVKVDARLRTTNPRVYAAGDVCSRFKFTHAADAMARVVIQNALFLGRARASALTIPWCTYTDPEIAHVGLTSPRRRSAASQ